MTAEEIRDTETESSNITISDPEFARMLKERGGPLMSDIPRYLQPGPLSLALRDRAELDLRLEGAVAGPA